MHDKKNEALVYGHPNKPLVYSSPAITERRKRILREARKLISDRGVEHFSIRELCRRADVAQRTLYNAFKNKDRILALAIREAYVDVNNRIRYSTSPDTLDGILDRLIAINQRNFRARNYTKAVTNLYFSSTTSPDILRSLQDMAFINLHRWLDQVVLDGELGPWIKRVELEQYLVNAEYATINDWARGWIDDEDYIRRLLETILIIAVGATIGETHDKAIKILTEIRQTGEVPKYPKPVFVGPME